MLCFWLCGCWVLRWDSWMHDHVYVHQQVHRFWIEGQWDPSVSVDGQFPCGLGSGDHGHWGGAGNLAVDKALWKLGTSYCTSLAQAKLTVCLSLWITWFDLRHQVLHCDRPSQCVLVQIIRFEACTCTFGSVFWKKLSEGRLQTVWGCRQIRTTVGKNATLFTASNSKGLKRTQHDTTGARHMAEGLCSRFETYFSRPAACRCITLLSSLEDLYEQPGCIIQFADTMTWVSPVIAHGIIYIAIYAICYMKEKLHSLLADCLLRLLCIRAGIQGWSQQCGSFEVEANERSFSSQAMGFSTLPMMVLLGSATMWLLGWTF